MTKREWLGRAIQGVTGPLDPVQVEALVWLFDEHVSGGDDEHRHRCDCYRRAVTWLLECSHGDETMCGCRDKALAWLASIDGWVCDECHIVHRKTETPSIRAGRMLCQNCLVPSG